MTDRALELSVLTMGLVVDKGMGFLLCGLLYSIFIVCCSKRVGRVLCM